MFWVKNWPFYSQFGLIKVGLLETKQILFNYFIQTHCMSCPWELSSDLRPYPKQGSIPKVNKINEDH